MRTKTASNGLVLLLGVFVILGLALVVSNHARTGHAANAYSSAAVFDALENCVNGREGPCQRLEAASCPFATNHDKRSTHYGSPSPQARVYCMLDNGTGSMAVFGLGRPPAVVYVTGYQLPYAQWQWYNERDSCAPTDIAYMQWLFVEALR